jgi:hypothetical protein
MLIFDNRFVLGCLYLGLSIFCSLNYLSNIIEGKLVWLSVFLLIACLVWVAYAFFLIVNAINDNE